MTDTKTELEVLRNENLALKQELAQHNALLQEVEEQSIEFQSELFQARSFQQLLVTLPPLRDVKVYAFYEPMGLIGGDLYAISQLGKRIRVFIADATGHGIRASLTTMFIKSGYESFAMLDDPSLVLQELNDSIANTYRSSEMLFTAACADIHLDTGAVVLVCAGHPPACVIKDGTIVVIDANGAPMGVQRGMKYEKETLTLSQGDGLYLYTDGITEARVERSHFFGESRLYEAIRKAHIANEDVADKVREDLFGFVGTFRLADDASFIGVRLE